MPELRVARAADIPRLVEIRAAVRENRLHGVVIGSEAYRPYVDDARCWVWEKGAAVQGFAALDAEAASIWALFVDPATEGLGIGSALLDAAIAEARRRGLARLILETDQGTRAEAFYRAAGWRIVDRDATDTLKMALDL